jgi:AraC family transcriptional regulator, regulatory protein of adaptative response / methylated-DNA-[protein]-cysteine methyltransferase
MTDFERITRAIEYITSNRKQQPTLDQVAAEVNLSPYHFQRMFSEWAGVSPKKFLQYLTVEYAKQLLTSGQHLTLFNAADEAGLSGPGRLHDLFVNIESMTPAEYRDGGAGVKICYSTSQSSFGPYLVASTPTGVCHLAFFDGELESAIAQLKSSWPMAKFVEAPDGHQEKVHRFFNHELQPGNKLNLHLRGTPFQLKVWEALLKIRSGELATYGTVASTIGQPAASRAVGSAVASNPVGFIIPCHRVIRSAGIVGDFRWGEPRKRAMIGWEASQRFSAIERV